jgi:hypothetical protein
MLLKSGRCGVDGSQAGSATISPAAISQEVTIISSLSSPKRLNCVKGSNSKIVNAAKCPIGYKLKK